MTPASYYEVLEVKPDAPQHEVTKAYERAKTTYAIDNPALYTVFTPEEAKDLLQMIEEAYTVLGNAIYRSRYDEKLKDPSAKPEELHFRAIVGQFVPTTGDRSRQVFKPNYDVNPVLEEQINSEEHCDGTFLKKVREYKKINREKMAEVTRISQTYIDAIECNEYLSLPASVFVRGFVVQIAKTLGLDSKKTADSYMKIMKSNLEATK